MSRDLLEISRRRKRRWALIRYGSWTAMSLLFFGLAISIFYLPFFKIKTIIISGTENLDADTIKLKINSILDDRYFYLIPKNNIFLYPKHKIETIFSKNDRIENYEISRNYLTGALAIYLSERKTWAVWCPENNESACYLIDQAGYVFAEAPSLSGSAILKIMDDRTISKPISKKIFEKIDIDRMGFFIDELKTTFGEDVQSIDVKSGSIFQLHVKAGWYAILDSELADYNKALENLSLTLGKLANKRSSLEYIDLRFRDKVFYRLQGAPSDQGI